MTIDSDLLSPHPIPLIYKQIGAEIQSLDQDRGAGTLRVRPNLRTLNGPSAAALAVLLQDLSAVTVARFAPLVVPIQISVRIRSTAADVAELFAQGDTLRRGRAVQFTDATYSDSANRSNVVAFATGSWATMGSNLAEPRNTLHGPGTIVPGDPADVWEFADLLDAIGAHVTSDGTGVEMGEVNAGATEPIALGGTATGTLHAGAMQVLAEHAAVIAATGQADASQLMIMDMSTQFLAPARVTPLNATGRVVSVSDATIDTRVEIREDGGNGRLVALSYSRFGVS